jgi:hypothetical protein
MDCSHLRAASRGSIKNQSIIKAYAKRIEAPQSHLEMVVMVERMLSSSRNGFRSGNSKKQAHAKSIMTLIGMNLSSRMDIPKVRGINTVAQITPIRSVRLCCGRRRYLHQVETSIMMPKKKRPNLVAEKTVKKSESDNVELPLQSGCACSILFSTLWHSFCNVEFEWRGASNTRNTRHSIYTSFSLYYL